MLYGYKIAALCIAKVSDEESLRLISAINDSLVKIGYRLFIYNTCTDLFWGIPSEEGEISVYDLIDFSFVDALMIYDSSIKNRKVVKQIINKSLENNTPVISIDGVNENCINIGFDYEKGFEMIVRHVVEYHNCTDIHYMGGIRGNTFSESRMRIIQKVLNEKGVKFGRQSVSYGDFWADPARAAALKLIESKEVPKAIICANDAMALAVSTALIENGYRIPDDVIVTGFDGLVSINFSSPKITSCSYSYEDMADKICELLKKAGNGENCNGDYLVGFTLLGNESCGCEGRKVVSPAKYIDEVSSSFARYQTEECSIYTHVANIHLCETVEQVYSELVRLNLYGTSIMLNEECINDTINPLSLNSEKKFSDEMCLLFEYGTGFKPRLFSRKDIAPEMEYLLQLERPVIFNALSFQNIPLGYACFFYETILRDYCRIPQIINALSVAVGGFRNIRYQKFLTNRIEEISRTDSLTGLYNRSGFADMMNETAEMFMKNKNFTIISADLDGLKYINDTYGHAEGDWAIRKAAEAIRCSIPGNKICARFGGDEFAAITDNPCADTIRNDVNRFLKQYNRNSAKPYDVSVSVGAYEFVMPEKNEDFSFDEILKVADNLMYQEKYSKPNRRK